MSLEKPYYYQVCWHTLKVSCESPDAFSKIFYDKKLAQSFVEFLYDQPNVDKSSIHLFTRDFRGNKPVDPKQIYSNMGENS